jgi:photosystem II stability/assembly factor-like uncharacterized protein
MKNILLFIILLYSGFASGQWQSINLSSSPDLFDLSFPSNQTGYVCGYGNRFHKTTNGGTNWLDLSFAGTAQNLNAVCFVNNKTGFLASTNDTIYKTSDGGVTWYYRYFLGIQADNIQFLDSLTGFAFAINVFSVTTNGGANWSNSPAPTSGGFYFLNSLTGWTTYYSGGGNSQLMKTTNGGANWTMQLSTTNFRIMYDVFFINQNTGWVSGYRHLIEKTTDGGASWVVQNDLESAGGLYSIYFKDENTGWTVGDYYSSNATSCYYTTNGGSNWLKENSVTSGGRIEKVRFSSPTNGWIAGQYGKVFKTDNAGGLTGISNAAAAPEKFELSQNYPNPFNPSTKISFAIPKTGFVSLKVYDVTGKEVRTLVNDLKSAGNYSVDFNASNLSSGIYFYRIESEGFSRTMKMILVK